MRKFVITDIHGCRQTFQALLDKIAFTSADQLFLLGDYTDRGPDSKGLIDDIMDLENKGYQVKCILGNHEQEMIRGREDLAIRANWWRWGGRETTASFGLKHLTDVPQVPQKYWDWLLALPVYWEEENFILVHAGLNFSVPDPLTDHENIVWIRNWYDRVDYDWLDGRIILHGHTPATQETIENQLKNLNKQAYLDLDNGCYKSTAGEGQLCAFEMTNRELIFQERIDEITWRR